MVLQQNAHSVTRCLCVAVAAAAAFCEREKVTELSVLS